MPSPQLIQLVAEDVAEGLREIFETRDAGFEPRRTFEDGIGDDTLAAVPWSYTCAHTGDFQGIMPTGRTLRIEGLTIVDGRDSPPAFIRYVDWAGVFAQLGLHVSTRVALDHSEYEYGVARYRELHPGNAS